MSLSTLPRRRIHRAVDGRSRTPRVDLRRAAAAIPAPTRRRDRAPGSDVAGLPACCATTQGCRPSSTPSAAWPPPGFAALLYSVVTGDSVTAALTQLVQRALTAGF